MDTEYAILNYIQENYKSLMFDNITRVLAYLGSMSMIWVVLTIICLIVKKYRRVGISLAANFIFNAVAANVIIKTIVARPRPCTLNTTVELITKVPFDASFPSGHTLYAFGAATIIFIYNKWLGILAYIFAIIMGLSRMYAYVHFPTDVLFGAIFGILFAITSYILEQMIFGKKTKAPAKY